MFMKYIAGKVCEEVSGYAQILSKRKFESKH